MRYNQILSTVSAVVLIASCSVAEPDDVKFISVQDQTEITITASLGEPETRTIREADGSVLWSPGDQISLFYGRGNSGGSCFTAQNTEAAKVVNFTGQIGVITGGNDVSMEGTWFWATYPYCDVASCDGASITTVLPYAQLAKADTFADDLFPSMGRSRGLDVAFYNICGGVKFTISEEGIRKVMLEGNSGELMAGKITTVFDPNGLPAITRIANGSDIITLSAPKGETLMPGKAYYMVLAPTVFDSGFTLTFFKSDSCAKKVLNSKVTIRRSVFGTLTTPDKNLEWVPLPEQGMGIGIDEWDEGGSIGGNAQ